MSDEHLFSKKPTSFLHRWSVVTSLGALIISSLSLFFSIKNETYSSAPNVQILEVKHYVADDVDSSKKEVDFHNSVEIGGTVTLKNFGRASTQLIKVNLDLPGNSQLFDPQRIKIAFSDDAITPSNYSRSDEDLITVTRNRTIKAGEIRKFYTKLFIDTHNLKGHPMPNLFRVLLIFSNGQELTFVPEIKTHITISKP
jgi:hypothetical protein